MLVVVLCAKMGVDQLTLTFAMEKVESDDGANPGRPTRNADESVGGSMVCPGIRLSPIH
jgi:hypothetical protein